MLSWQGLGLASLEMGRRFGLSHRQIEKVRKVGNE